jgi:glycosyltransferase involved in cell wall biosynthesis
MSRQEIRNVFGQGKPRICFVAHLAYGAMAGGNSGFVGGVERQTSLMARWFASRGYQVRVLTWDEGQQDGAEIDGVRVFKMCRRDAGVKGLRFFWPKWTSLVAAMKRADAEIYYQNCGEYVTGQVALWCRRHSRRFVYSVANDADCDARLPEMHKLRERVLYRYGLKHADRVIVQTRRQQDMLRTHFELDSAVIPMPCPGPSADDYVACERVQKRGNRVLWIGRVCEQKRPDRLLDLAEACPDLHFDLVGPAADNGYARSVWERAKNISNVTLHGPASRGRVSEFYKNSGVMCCTSDFEGFPNTFLEAWSYGVPIVTTFDPDNLIARNELGIVAQNVKGLESGIRTLLGDSQQWQQASHAARRYYLGNHTTDAVMPKFEKVFSEIINTTPLTDLKK